MKIPFPFLLPILRSVLFILGSLAAAFMTKQSLQDISQWWTPLFSLLNILTILLLGFICKNEGIRFRDLFLSNDKKTTLRETLLIILMMMLVGIGGMILFSIAFYQSVPTFLIHPLPIWLAMINLILLPLTVVFAELPLFFGYSMRKIEESTGRKGFAAAYVIFFYALQHSFIPLILDFRFMLFRFFSFLPLMILLAFLYGRSKKLTGIMIGHGVMDFATAIQILLASLG